MAANLGLVVNAAEADADELATGGLRNALAERRLAHAGRADEAQDRTAALWIELAHRQVFEDAALDLLETEVIVIENSPCLADVDRRAGVERPRQLDQPLEVRADHRILARGLRHPLEALQLLARGLLDFLGHARFGDGLFELRDVGTALVAFAKLLLDRAQLLAQQVLAVGVGDRFARALVDLARDLEDLDPVRQQVQHLVESRLEVKGFEQRLLFLGTDVHQPGNEVRELRRAVDALQRGDHFLGHLRQELQDLDGALFQRLRATLDLRADFYRIVDELHACDGKWPAVEELQHAKAPQPARNRVMCAIGGGHVANDRGARADPVQVCSIRLVDVGLALQQHAERTLEAHGLLRGDARALASDRQRNDGAGEHDDVAHRQDDQRVFGKRARRGVAACALRGAGRLRGSAPIDGYGVVDRLRVFVHVVSRSFAGEAPGSRASTRACRLRNDRGEAGCGARTRRKEFQAAARQAASR